MKPREIEFEMNGIYHAACYTLNRNGTLYIEDLVRDNGDGGCEPCELTHAINYQLHKLLSDEIEEAKVLYDFESGRKHAGIHSYYRGKGEKANVKEENQKLAGATSLFTSHFSRVIIIHLFS